MSDAKQLVQQLQRHGILNLAVLDAFLKIPRENFVNPDYRDQAYADRALPLKHGQTISQPYIVAKMTETILAGNQRLNNVLEIGTGSGYQAAILSCVADNVYSVERIQALYDSAKKSLKPYPNIHCHYGDGRLGWPAHAPYEAIIVTAASADIPDALKQQLADGGRMIIPVDDGHHQQLLLITRQGDQFYETRLEFVMFVPLLQGIEG